MRKALFALLALVGAMILFLSMWLFFRPETLRPQNTQQMYLLKDNGGKIAVYSAQDPDTPLRTYEIYTYLLPEMDVLALQQGIPVNSDAELQARLEDFGL